MKKLLSLLLALMLCLSLAACGANTGNNGGSAANGDDASQEGQTDAGENSDAQQPADEPEEGPQDAGIELPHSDKFTVADGKVSFVDALGNEVSLTIKPERVVTLSTTWHDLWYDCGGTAVGRVDEPLCTLRNEDAAAVEIIGSSYDVSLEAVLAKEPDLVIVSDKDMAAALGEAGVEYLYYDYEDFEGFLETLELYTILTDRPDLYEQWATDNIQRVNAVREICAQQEPAQIVMLLPHATSGIYALRNSGFLGNLLYDMNTVNVAFQDVNGEEAKNFVISMEELLKLDPQFILSRGGSGDGSVETATAIFETNPLWFELTAVKEGRFHHLPSELFLYKANVRYGEAYEYLAQILYPDAFAE